MGLHRAGYGHERRRYRKRVCVWFSLETKGGFVTYTLFPFWWTIAIGVFCLGGTAQRWRIGPFEAQFTRYRVTKPNPHPAQPAP